jgi:translocation and assembly module TamB
MSDSSSAPPATAPKKPRPRRVRRKLAAFVLLLVVVAGLPPVVGRTALRNRIIPLIFPELEGRVSLGATRLGWLQPMTINDLKILDADDSVLLHARQARSQFTLLDLLLEPSDLGEWNLSAATVQLTVRPGTTNLEEFLETLAGPETSASYSFSLNAHETTLHVRTEGDAPASTYQLPRANWKRSRDASHRWSGELIAPGDTPGTVDFDLTAAERWSGFVKIRRWDCSRLQPLALRLRHDFQLQGEVVEAGLMISSRTDSPRLEATLAMTDLFLAEADRTLADLRSLEISLQLDATAQGFHLQQLSGRSEFGTLALDGAVLIPTLDDERGLSEIADELLAQAFSLEGDVQLGELSRRLPGVLRIREGVRVGEGRLKFVARSRPADSTLETSLSVTDLVAETPTQPLRWDNPFEAVGRIRKEDGLWRLDDLSIASAGIQVRGTGRLAEADLSATINLTEFQQQWSRLLDTNRWSMGGTLDGSFSSRRTGPREFQLTANARGERVTLGAKAGIPWDFPRLDARMTGTVIGEREWIWREPKLDLDTGQERLSAHGQADGSWRLSGSGELEGIARRLLARTSEDRLSGRYDFEADFRSTPQRRTWDPLKLTVENLSWSSGGVRIDEQKLIVEGAASYLPETGTYDVPLLTLNSATLAARLTEARISRDNPQVLFTGQLAARGRMERIARWHVGTSSHRGPHGLLNLQLKATAGANETSEFRWNLFTEGLTWKSPRAELPAHAVSFSPAGGRSESEITWSGTGTYLPDPQRLELTSSEVDAGFMRWNLTGRVTDLATAPLLSLSGQCDYDWSVLRRRFPDLIPPELEIHGRSSNPVAFSIPLTEAASGGLAGTIPVQWDSAMWHKLPIGPGRTEAVLADSRVDFQPVKTSLAGGNLRLAPSVILSGPGVIIEQAPETILEQIHLSEAICRDWLKFVSPLTADASRVEGTISLKTSTLLRLPLEDSRSAAGSGVLQIHAARMTPGPLAMRIVALEQQLQAIRSGSPLTGPPRPDPRAVLTIEQQLVPFEIKDGRVSHRDLKMKLKDLDISTSGSVGFDETIDLTVEMEIPESWTAQGKRLRDIWGPSLKIPIRGTLNQPLTDPRFVDGLLKQLARGSATNFLENQLNKQFNNLFGPRK